MRQVGALDKMYKEYGSRVEFMVVYIREAHPNNKKPQPKEMEQRIKLAQELREDSKLEMPILIDGMDDKTGKVYGGFPDRLYLVGTDGKITYKGARGPFGFRPEELKEAMDKELSAK